jgi:hypothetical protein
LIRAFQLTNVDQPFTFYYDETNNVRRLHLTPEGLNIRSPDCFVLGGIVHRGSPRPFDLDALRTQLGLQKTVKEIKLKHLGKGDFLALLASLRVGAFLDWVASEDLLVHYQVIDLLYWSIVDIVDSILTESKAWHLLAIAPMIKDSLYTLLRNDIDGTAELLGRYNYPNVGPERRHDFLAELLELVACRGELLDHFSYQMLKGVLQMGAKLDALPYLEDETPNVLIDGFGIFFLNRIITFTSASHILDNEKQIQRFLKERELTYRGKLLAHFRFADSQSEPGVQLSDPITGLLGKLFTYVNRKPPEEIDADLTKLSDVQSRNLASLAMLLDRSTDESQAFAQRVLSAEDQQRAALLLDRAARVKGGAGRA